MKLTQEQQDRARAFVYGHARALERRLFSYYFQEGAAEDVLAELATFQNGDGGFGHALEPDLRLADSSVIATTVGLQILRDLGVDEEHPLVKSAIQYLLATYDAEREVWPIIPPNVDEAPHAPWWQYDQDVLDPVDNPRAVILGYLFDYANLVPADLLDRLAGLTMSRLDALPDTMQMDNLRCYFHLAENSSLPGDLRAMVLDSVGLVAGRVLARDAATWKRHVLKPLDIVASPHSPFAAMFAREVEVNLDYEIEQQQADGSWEPNWWWGGAFPEVWEEAKREWKGIMVVDKVSRLRNFGRLE